MLYTMAQKSTGEVVGAGVTLWEIPSRGLGGAGREALNPKRAWLLEPGASS